MRLQKTNRKIKFLFVLFCPFVIWGGGCPSAKKTKKNCSCSLSSRSFLFMFLLVVNCSFLFLPSFQTCFAGTAQQYMKLKTNTRAESLKKYLNVKVDYSQNFRVIVLFAKHF